MSFQLGTSYDMHVQNISSANFQSQRKMPWDLTMTTPWEVSKKMRGERLFNFGILPPVPGSCKTLDKTGLADFGEAARCLQGGWDCTQIFQ